VSWRVIFPLGIAVALALGAVGVWENQRLDLHHKCTHFAAIPAIPSYTLTNPLTGKPERFPGHKGSKATTVCLVNHRATYHHDATLVWYAAASVALLTLASLPLLMQRERHRAAV
jgi:hypothetical protein